MKKRIDMAAGQTCVPGGQSAAEPMVMVPVSLLHDARDYVGNDLEILLSSFCLEAPDGSWDRTTLSEDDRPYVERADELLARIDAALNKVDG